METIPVYTFDELDRDVQEAVLEREAHRIQENGLVLDLLVGHARDEMDNRNLDLKTYFDLYGRGGGVAFDGSFDIGDLLDADTESWTETKTRSGRRNVHLKPSTVRDAIPTLLDEYGEDFVRGLGWRLDVPGRGLFQRIDEDTLFDDVHNLKEELEEQGDEDRADAIWSEANALNALVTDFIDALSHDLFIMLREEDKYYVSEESMRESGMLEARRWTWQGVEV